MSLNIVWVGLQDALEFSNRLGSFAVFGEHAPQIISRADKVWIEADGSSEFFERLVASTGTIQHDT